MTITGNLPRFSFEAAVWIFGGYPQRSWDSAVRILALKIRTIAKSNEISPTTIFILGRKTFGKSYKFI